MPVTNGKLRQRDLQMRTALLVLTMLFGGCMETYYNRPDTTTQQVNADLYQCTRETATPEGSGQNDFYNRDLCMRARGYTVTH
jgi:hypothetical protein